MPEPATTAPAPPAVIATVANVATVMPAPSPTPPPVVATVALAPGLSATAVVPPPPAAVVDVPAAVAVTPGPANAAPPSNASAQVVVPPAAVVVQGAPSAQAVTPAAEAAQPPAAPTAAQAQPKDQPKAQNIVLVSQPGGPDKSPVMVAATPPPKVPTLKALTSSVPEVDTVSPKKGNEYASVVFNFSLGGLVADEDTINQIISALQQNIAKLSGGGMLVRPEQVGVKVSPTADFDVTIAPPLGVSAYKVLTTLTSTNLLHTDIMKAIMPIVGGSVVIKTLTAPKVQDRSASAVEPEEVEPEEQEPEDQDTPSGKSSKASGKGENSTNLIKMQKGGEHRLIKKKEKKIQVHAAEKADEAEASAAVDDDESVEEKRQGRGGEAVAAKAAAGQRREHGDVASGGHRGRGAKASAGLRKGSAKANKRRGNARARRDAQKADYYIQDAPIARNKRASILGKQGNDKSKKTRRKANAKKKQSEGDEDSDETTDDDEADAFADAATDSDAGVSADAHATSEADESNDNELIEAASEAAAEAAAKTAESETGERISDGDAKSAQNVLAEDEDEDEEADPKKPKQKASGRPRARILGASLTGESAETSNRVEALTDNTEGHSARSKSKKVEGSTGSRLQVGANSGEASPLEVGANTGEASPLEDFKKAQIQAALSPAVGSSALASLHTDTVKPTPPLPKQPVGQPADEDYARISMQRESMPEAQESSYGGYDYGR
eukprot:TRINITY_DN16779_c0_g2_i3.p1 TRINITY_DN16779_c0_g2~~TRINITY_DN16779_c0_g2_i3.p1  ORF type:complete len:855 (-),score=195.94 TRINITY_DN16779_c0_g2_i3:92-2272(-)